MRLIDADELKSIFTEKSTENVCGAELCKAIISRIYNAPTIDAVPVIRCKDCKFSMSGIDKYNERYILCQLHERSYGVIDDGFCNWAERKEE